MTRRKIGYVAIALAGACWAMPPGLEAKNPAPRAPSASGAPALLSAPAMGQASPLLPEQPTRAAHKPNEPTLAPPRPASLTPAAEPFEAPAAAAPLEPASKIANEPVRPRPIAEPEDVATTRQGQWTQWDEGRALWTCEFREGKRHGKATRFFTAGEGPLFAEPPAEGFSAPFEARAVFAQGKMTGTCTLVDSQRRTLCDLSVKDDELEGESIWYYPSGQMREVSHYHSGLLAGKRLEYASEGQLVKEEDYLGGRPTVVEMTNYETGQKQMRGRYFLAGPMEHSQFDWLRGEWTTTVLENYPSDVRTGPWTWWHPTGQRQLEGNYDEDRPEGTFTWWYDNGQKERQGSYVDGLQSGKWSWWFPTGQKQIEGFYVAGELSGDWQFWQEDGSLVRGDAAKVTARVPQQPSSQARRTRQPNQTRTQ